MADLEIRQIKGYGWKPDLPDARDLQFTSEKVNYPIHSTTLLGKYNHPPVYDQGQLGSCTANALAFLVEFYLMNKSTSPNPDAKLYMPSRLFIYYYERLMEGSINYDSGAQIRDGIKVLARKGVSDENKWPYNIKKFAEHPSDDAINEAKKFQALEYQRIDNTNKGLLIAALDAGHPIAFGFTVYESFESREVAKDGIVPMPQRGESVLGGHATAIVGYDLPSDRFKVRNSWGPDWADNGYFTIPADYVTNDNLADDFWVVTKIEN